MNFSSVSNLVSRATQLARQIDTSVTVKLGDSLSTLAQRHNISLQDLLDANPHKKANPHLIHPGEVITIPSSPKFEAQNTATHGIPSHHPIGTSTHSLGSLAELIAKFAAQEPKIYTGSPIVTAAPQTVTVAKGDTLSAIAQRFDVSTDALRSANGLHPADDRSLAIGKELRLPEGTKEIANKQPATQASGTNGNASLQASDINQATPITPKEKTAVSGEDIANEAKRYLGLTPKTVVNNGELPAMEPNHGANCANFVSAVLVKSGLLKPDEHTVKVVELQKKLENDKAWTAIKFQDNKGEINKASLQEGDVIFMKGHVEFIARNDKDELVAIGSNGDSGKQRIRYHENWNWLNGEITTVLRQP